MSEPAWRSWCWPGIVGWIAFAIGLANYIGGWVHEVDIGWLLLTAGVSYLIGTMVEK